MRNYKKIGVCIVVILLIFVAISTVVIKEKQKEKEHYQEMNLQTVIRENILAMGYGGADVEIENFDKSDGTKTKVNVTLDNQLIEGNGEKEKSDIEKFILGCINGIKSENISIHISDTVKVKYGE